MHSVSIRCNHPRKGRLPSRLLSFPLPVTFPHFLHFTLARTRPSLTSTYQGSRSNTIQHPLVYSSITFTERRSLLFVRFPSSSISALTAILLLSSIGGAKKPGFSVRPPRCQPSGPPRRQPPRRQPPRRRHPRPQLPRPQAPKTRTMSALRVYCETCGQKCRQSLGQHTETHKVNGKLKCPQCIHR
jgi:hypothetical protein